MRKVNNPEYIPVKQRNFPGGVYYTVEVCERNGEGNLYIPEDVKENAWNQIKPPALDGFGPLPGLLNAA